MREQLLQRLQKVFCNVFGDEELNIHEATSAQDIDMWDSLTHLELIAAAEEEFNIKITFTEAMQFNTVGDLLNIIQKRINP